MKVTIEVSDENFQHAVGSAYDGISYWGTMEGVRGGYRVTDTEDNSIEHLLSFTKVREAVATLATVSPKHFSNLLGSGMRIDRDTGDALIQCACFGELRYS